MPTFARYIAYKPSEIRVYFWEEEEQDSNKKRRSVHVFNHLFFLGVTLTKQFRLVTGELCPTFHFYTTNNYLDVVVRKPTTSGGIRVAMVKPKSLALGAQLNSILANAGYYFFHETLHYI